MKILLSIAFSFTCFTFLNAQVSVNDIDSCIYNYEYETAINLIEQQDSLSETLLSRQAMCYKLLNDYQRATSIYSSLLDIDSSNRGYKIELANCYLMANDLKKALTLYIDLGESSPNNRFFQLQQAEILFRMKKYGESASIYLHLLESDTLSDYYKKVGQCYEAMEDYDEAMHYYKQAWDKNSSDAFSAASFINLNLKKELFEEAVQYSEEYKKHDTTNLQINLLNALSYYSVDDYSSAITKLTAVRESGDSSLVVNRSLGMSYYLSGEYDDAAKYLALAYAQNNKDNNVLYGLATSCLHTYELEKAVDYYSALLLAVTPTDDVLFSFNKGLATAYSKQKVFDKAIEKYLVALKLDINTSQRIELLHSLADIYDDRLKDREQSIFYYKQLLEAYKNKIKVFEDQRQKENVDSELIEEKIDVYIGYCEKIEHRIAVWEELQE